MTTTKLPKAFSPEALAELSADVQLALSRPWSPIDPNVVEIIGSTARWYVLEVRNRDAEAELIKRRFGVYVPECEETIIRGGRRITRRGPLIPGYVFVFFWESDENWLRAITTPGVVAVLGALPDEEIEGVRIAENSERLDARARARLKERVLRKVRPVTRKKSRRVKRRGRTAALA